MKVTKKQLRKIIREALSTEVPELTGGKKSSSLGNRAPISFGTREKSHLPRRTKARRTFLNHFSLFEVNGYGMDCHDQFAIFLTRFSCL